MGAGADQRHSRALWFTERMLTGQPSLTARGVALVRAGIDRPSAPEGDDRIDARLADGFGDAGRGEPAIGAGRRPRMVSYIAARTRFFDHHLIAAVAAGCNQVVLLGAGYDTRAIRFRTAGVQFFEVDFPSTQVDKRARLDALGASTDGITFVTADFERDDVAQALAEAGHDAARPTFFICEGVLTYLTEPTIHRLLVAAARRAARGSSMALTLPVPRAGTGQTGEGAEAGDAPGLTDEERAAARAAFEQRLAAAGEPRRTTLSPDEGRALLRDAGWTERVDPGSERSPRLVVVEPSTAD
jgi:methyltransferase (TIGR00027 family)